MKSVKKTYLWIIFCILILSIPQISSQHSIDITDGIDSFSQNETVQTKIDNSLRVKEIENSGIGLSIIIENQGAEDIKNINLHLESISNNFILIPMKNYKIQQLSKGSQKKINFMVFGFGIGLQKDFPTFLLTITSSKTQTIEMQLKANIIGPYVEIILEYLKNDASYEGYTLFTPMWGTETYLMKNNGEIVHEWKNSIYSDAQTCYLMENGNIARTSVVASSSFLAGGYQGRVEIFDWDDNVEWQFEYATTQHNSHHDIDVLPNGNILMIAWELKSFEEAVRKGKIPENLQGNDFWPDHIIEVKPTGLTTGDIVWEWHAWDHIIQDYDVTKQNYGVIADHPELIDINFGGRRSDWLHINSVDYHEEFDQILVSVHNFNEIWVIDHSTSTEEAAGHTGGRYGKGGDILYRWGNPQAYDMGDQNDQKLFGQHDATWISNDYPGGGNILVFNNGAGSQPSRYSSIDEINPPVNKQGFYFYKKGFPFAPSDQSWRYIADNPSDIYSTTMSGAQRLPNGNTLICSANAGFFTEVTFDKKVVWSYYNPYPIGFFNKNVGKIRRYDFDYPGLSYL